MESSKDISSMFDEALKPKLLRSLLRDFVPNDKHTFNNISGILHLMSTIKSHKLLSECASVDKELIGVWKDAVDSWVKRLLALASSDSQEKCCAGIILLGMTSQECSSKRFLDSHSLWLNKLISHIQPLTVPHCVKVAACAALSDLFTRLSRFQNEKKDGTSQATKVIEPTLKILNDGSSLIEEALHLLCTLMNFFPASIHRHYDTVEAAIVSKILSGKCYGVLKKLSYSLSLLPKSRGDKDSWFLMMERILLSINNRLNDALQGLEEDARSNGAMLVLIHSGNESLLPLGGLSVHELTSDLSTRMPERLLGSRICALMSCCSMMLTSSYPVQVLVPVQGLVALAGRVLMVDGSLSQSSLSCMTTLKQEFICSELPLLQSQSLEILTAIIKGLSSQALRHVPEIVRLVTDYLRRCTFPELRVRAYKILKVLLMSNGVGIAIHMSQDVINSAFIDLDFSGCKKDDTSSKTSTDVFVGSRRKRRKHSHVTGSFPEQVTRDSLDVEMPLTLTPISVKVAALEALEALLTVGGGSLKSESWRTNVDHLIITVVTKAFKGGWRQEEINIFLSGELGLSWADFQLAVLRALLASLLSPGHTRPSNLALGLELFRAGIQERGTRLAEFCGHALLSLEMLNHPRTLPLLDIHSSIDDYKRPSHKFSDSIYLGGHGQISTLQIGVIGKDHCEAESEDDDLNENWFGNDSEEMEIQITEMQQNADDTEEPHVMVKNPTPGSLPSVKSTSVTMALEGSELGVSARILTKKILVDGDNFTDESPILQINMNQASVGDKMASTDNEVAVVHDPSHGLSAEREHLESETKNDELTPIVERISATLSRSVASKGPTFEPDNESYMDSIPDIIDGDPDSD